MDLQKALLKSPREKSGPRTSNRFDYQKNWSICKLLELYQEKSDFLLILDLHEDIIILDSSKDPKKASFFQVKTNQTEEWSLKDLIKTKKNNKNLSKLGKLYYNKVKFKDKVESLNFVSNRGYKIELDGKDKKIINQRLICVNDLCSSDKQTILLSLSKEFNLKLDEIDGNIIFFKISDLGINSHSDTTKGKLSEFIEKQKPNSKYKLGIIYTTIFDEIRKKTNEELDCSSFEDILKYKSISKNDFDKIIDTISKSFEEDSWKDVSTALISENFPLSERIEIKNNWDKYSIEILDQTNRILQKLKNKLTNIILNLNQKEIKTCKELLEKVLEEYSKIKSDEENLFKENYIKAVILKEYYLK